MRQLRLLIGTLVTVGLLAGLVVSPAYADPPFAPPGLERAMAAQERYTNQVLAIPNVVGTAVGFGADGRPVVKIYTESADVAGLPRLLDGIPVVVQVTGKIFALHHCKGSHFDPDVCDAPLEGGGPPAPDPEEIDPTVWFERPVPIGVSTGHPEITAGTIGARLIDGAGYVYALSNNHVYANLNLTPPAGLGDNVLQPGTFDGGMNSTDAIGTLAKFMPIQFDLDLTDATPGPNNVVDAAIALSDTLLLGNATPSDGYGTPKSTTVSAFINQKVQKYGRTTSLTKGRVTGINATVDVCYDDLCSLVARFVDQIVIEGKGRVPFSLGGDSGSLIVSDDKNDKRKLVGLLFAGATFLNANFTFANPIDPVLDGLAAELGAGLTIDGD